MFSRFRQRFDASAERHTTQPILTVVTVTEYIPGLGVVPRLRDADRWRLAGEYSATHRPVGSWWRKRCPHCGNRCEFYRWAERTLTEKLRNTDLGHNTGGCR